jgi:hypothetical protein
MSEDPSNGQSNYVLDVQGRAAAERIPELSIDSLTPSLPYGTEIQDMLDRFKEDRLLGHLIVSIVRAAWFKKPGEAETLEDSLLEELVKAGLMKDKSDSPFRPFFTQDGDHFCIICAASQTPRRSLDRAIGHARKHFNHTIDGKFTNENTKRDIEARKKRNGGLYKCSIWYVSFFLRA